MSADYADFLKGKVRLDSRMGYRLVDMAQAYPDQPTLPEELLDDLPAMAAYHAAIRENKPEHVVDQLLRKVIDDLEQDFTAYKSAREARGSRHKKSA